MSVLVAESLSKSYGGLRVLDSVSLTVDAGCVTALVGSNGAGKTTLFRCLAGTLRPDSGRVLLAGRDLTRLPADARSRRGLVPTYQVGSVFQTLTVRENLLVAAENRHRFGLLQSFSNRQAREADDRVDLVCDELGLGGVADVPAGELPTGTLRLVELARALVTDPLVLLLDEPVSGLDRRQAAAVSTLLRGLAGAGKAVLLVEHDPAFVEEVADEVHELAGGSLHRVAVTAETGKPS
ncbi:MAG TPA: ATP-binding cassette domain-containing protein [Frankiaceae bacterium]|jgi:branched-chain amino acid transport system ATP-binding protein|nr:ATP-binding cassette domain-containing protein [Frankiaceae bacterium]